VSVVPPVCVYGWIKQWGGLRQFKLRGTGKVSAVFGLHVIAFNLIRLGNLLNPVDGGCMRCVFPRGVAGRQGSRSPNSSERL
jgi:hypothetical protein